MPEHGTIFVIVECYGQTKMLYGHFDSLDEAKNEVARLTKIVSRYRPDMYMIYEYGLEEQYTGHGENLNEEAENG